ncbi:MAG TPA: hypothetical protein VGF67_04075 [Ktedonobacteraceae bacterium]
MNVSPQLSRRWYRPGERECPVCQRTLRQAMTLTRRTVITLEGVVRLIHAGYRCPDAQGEGHQRTYRSVQADALALPGMTYGRDVYCWWGDCGCGSTGRWMRSIGSCWRDWSH